MNKKQDSNVSMIIKSCNEDGKECLNNQTSDLSVQNMDLNTTQNIKPEKLKEEIVLSF